VRRLRVPHRNPRWVRRATQHCRARGRPANRAALRASPAACCMKAPLRAMSRRAFITALRAQTEAMPAGVLRVGSSRPAANGRCRWNPATGIAPVIKGGNRWEYENVTTMRREEDGASNRRKKARWRGSSVQYATRPCTWQRRCDRGSVAARIRKKYGMVNSASRRRRRGTDNRSIEQFLCCRRAAGRGGYRATQRVDTHVTVRARTFAQNEKTV